MNLSCTVLLFQKAITIYISTASVSQYPFSVSLLATVLLSNKYRMIVHCRCNLHVSVSESEHIVINSLVIEICTSMNCFFGLLPIFFFLLDCFSPSDELVRFLHDYYIINNCPPNNRFSIYFVPDTFYYTICLFYDIEEVPLFFIASEIPIFV